MPPYSPPSSLPPFSFISNSSFFFLSQSHSSDKAQRPGITIHQQTTESVFCLNSILSAFIIFLRKFLRKLPIRTHTPPSHQNSPPPQNAILQCGLYSPAPNIQMPTTSLCPLWLLINYFWDKVSLYNSRKSQTHNFCLLRPLIHRAGLLEMFQHTKQKWIASPWLLEAFPPGEKASPYITRERY